MWQAIGPDLKLPSVLKGRLTNSNARSTYFILSFLLMADAIVPKACSTGAAAGVDLGLVSSALYPAELPVGKRKRETVIIDRINKRPKAGRTLCTLQDLM